MKVGDGAVEGGEYDVHGGRALSRGTVDYRDPYRAVRSTAYLCSEVHESCTTHEDGLGCVLFIVWRGEPAKCAAGFL